MQNVDEQQQQRQQQQQHDEHLQAASEFHTKLFADLPIAEAYRLSEAESQRRGMQKVSAQVDLTYGDVPFAVIAHALQAVNPRPGTVFYDLGSGVGRGVIAAALLHPFVCCIGIELLSDLHEAANEPGRRYKALRAAPPPELAAGRMADSCEFVNSDLFDINVDAATWMRRRTATSGVTSDSRSSDATQAPADKSGTEATPVQVNVLVFCCCVTWGRMLMHRLGVKLAEELPSGSVVITVGQRLPEIVDLGAGSGGKDRGAVKFEAVWRSPEAFEWGTELVFAHECVRLGVLAARRHRKAQASRSTNAH